ncbi:MAG TPA: class I SAM-dependent methyltransferase, partial [Roseiflexaceae bacterium]|nr:class I SAM-dependent methyltransferase [Roseiflexaceae bacterium]
MGDNFTDPAAVKLSLEDIYGESAWSSEALEEQLNQSPAPRGADMLYDAIGALGLGPQHLLLDVGCRDTAHTCELVRRYGCRALGVDPVAHNIAKAQALIARDNLAERMSAVEGRIEAVPADDASVDFIWCRDVLTHVPDLRVGLAECRRVLRPGGMMLVYMTLATESLEPREAAWLFPPLAAV